MKSKLRFLTVLLIPLLASCSSMMGVAKKDPAPCHSNSPVLATNSEKSYSSGDKERLPLAVELCSFPRSGGNACEPSGEAQSAHRGHDQATACRKNPRVPDLKFPVPAGALSSGFGFRRGVFHGGLDITACKGEPILACADGTVVATGSRKGYRSYGQTVLISHGNDVYTHYAHASRVLVRPGQKVCRGEKIALVGATGRATSPHLHFEVRVGSQLLNPYPYFSPTQLKGVVVAKNFFGRPMGPVSSRGRFLTISSSQR
ncbi:MAG: M23 family metallopeptidase [Desulfomonile tiedjei]|nr:M23 family metallopeptidase [Desulfomonile tiedjei]